MVVPLGRLVDIDHHAGGIALFVALHYRVLLSLRFPPIPFILFIDLRQQDAHFPRAPGSQQVAGIEHHSHLFPNIRSICISFLRIQPSIVDIEFGSQKV
mmetsp:Transcript_5107/g.2868  ORF Transcript_5107/g.2868 Transcript_5107/m.2868 type:complete len:99 (-) Transcript_5107:869-1165(-)